MRERIGDIRNVAEQRLEILTDEGHARKLSHKEWALLTEYDWPGNVRQLIKLVDRAVLLGMTITEALDEERDLGEVRLGRDRDDQNPEFLPRNRRDLRPMAEVQREYAERAWQLCERNYAATARALGVAENTLRYSYLKQD